MSSLVQHLRHSELARLDTEVGARQGQAPAPRGAKGYITTGTPLTLAAAMIHVRRSIVKC